MENTLPLTSRLCDNFLTKVICSERYTSEREYTRNGYPSGASTAGIPPPLARRAFLFILVQQRYRYKPISRPGVKSYLRCFIFPPHFVLANELPFLKRIARRRTKGHLNEAARSRSQQKQNTNKKVIIKRRFFPLSLRLNLTQQQVHARESRKLKEEPKTIITKPLAVYQDWFNHLCLASLSLRMATV